MTKIGTSSSGLGSDGSDIERDAADRAARSRFQRKNDSFGLGQGSRDTLGERQFRDDPHEQQARAQSFESRLADKMKGADAHKDPKAQAGKQAARKEDRGTSSLFATAGKQDSDAKTAESARGSSLFPAHGWASADERDARDSQGGDHDAKDDRRESAPRVLAVAEPRADSLSALFAPQAPSPPVVLPAQASVDGGATSTAERVAGIETRVEHAIQQELSISRAEPISFNIPVDPKIDGLMGLTVTMGPEALDIVLTRGGAPASDDLVRAAGALADRLQRRFVRQTVRILEVTVADEEGDEAVAPAAPDGVMSLFGRQA